jgi:phosphoribosyl-AMP cyclohydrolase
VLMLGYMNAEALKRTLTTGRTWFWSRSRSEYWCKGETSGDRQWVRSASYDCDGDAILVVVEQEGRGACHTGERTCFYRSFGDGKSSSQGDESAIAGDAAGVSNSMPGGG